MDAMEGFCADDGSNGAAAAPAGADSRDGAYRASDPAPAAVSRHAALRKESNHQANSERGVKATAAATASETAVTMKATAAPAARAAGPGSAAPPLRAQDRAPLAKARHRPTSEQPTLNIGLVCTLHAHLACVVGHAVRSRLLTAGSCVT